MFQGNCLIGRIASLGNQSRSEAQRVLQVFLADHRDDEPAGIVQILLIAAGDADTPTWRDWLLAQALSAPSVRHRCVYLHVAGALWANRPAPESVATFLRNGDSAVRSAAIPLVDDAESLVSIASEDADPTTRCAAIERLALLGHATRAAQLYCDLLASTPPRPIRKAALDGLYRIYSKEQFETFFFAYAQREPDKDLVELWQRRLDGKKR